MAKVEFEPSVAGFRGKMGRLTYRDYYGKTVVSGEYRRKKPWSATQRKGRERFREAQAYAKSVLADPLKRERYRELAAARGQPPNALLVANFLNPPTVDRVDLSAYRGRVGSVVRVLTTDAIEVVGVTVTARDEKGAVLETGEAEKDHDIWAYRCTTALDGVAAKLEVTAKNRAGTKGSSTVAL